MPIESAPVRLSWLHSKRCLSRWRAASLNRLRAKLRQTLRNCPDHRFPPAEEHAFRAFHAERIYPQARLGIALGFLAWCAFAAWDVLVFPEWALPLLATRLLLVAPVLAGLWWFAAHHPARFKARMSYYLTLAPLAASAGLLIMMGLTQTVGSPRSFHLFWPAFAGICFFQYAFLGLSVIPAAVLGICCLLFVSLFGIASGAGLPNVAGAVLELAMLNVLGAIICLRGEIHQRTLYRMHQRYRRQLAVACAERAEARSARDEALAERRRAEAATALARTQSRLVDESMRKKERFFTAAYHDLQQPLSIIGLYARLARSKLDHDPDLGVHADLTVIEEASAEIALMFKGVRDLWEIGRAEPNLGVVDLAELLAEVSVELRGQAERKGLRLRVKVRADTPCLVRSDRALLKRAISNLVSNGIKYTESGGVVMGAGGLGDRLRVIVRDTGIGVAAPLHEQIFEEYFRVVDPAAGSTRGLGLGLSIVKRIEKTLPEHRLSFWSKPRHGTRFTLTIPRAMPAVRHARGVAVAGRAPVSHLLAGKYVFVVEDEHLLLDGLVASIRAAGCVVEGVGCIDAARRVFAARDRCPDVLVTDYQLQLGKTGLDVVSIMRDRFEWAAATPVIFVTGELKWRAPPDEFHGAWEVFRKPIDPDVLVTRLGELVSLRRN